MSYAEQLAGVQAAITRLEDGAQEVRFGDRMVRYADLATLYAERGRLTRLAAQEAAGSGAVTTIRFATSKGI
jgi:hypothetical protein